MKQEQQKYGTVTEILKGKGELNDTFVDPCYDIFSLSSCVEFTLTFCAAHVSYVLYVGV